MFTTKTFIIILTNNDLDNIYDNFETLLEFTK